MTVSLGRLKDTIGFTLVILHLTAIALCYFLLRPRLDPNDFQLIILILSPITAVYSLAYLREVARYMLVGAATIDDKQPVTLRFAILAVVFTLAFSAGVIFTIYDYAGASAQSADDLKISLATMETALGAFLGLIVETLFGKIDRPAPDAP